MGRLKLFIHLKHDMWTYFVLYLVKWKFWDDPCREIDILAYRLLSLRNKKVELVPWFKTWYVNIFCFVFGKMKVLECSLSRKWDFSLYGYMFDKYEGWACPSMSLDAKHDTWIYLVLNSVNIKYWDDPCRKKRDISLYGCKFDKWDDWNCL